MNTLKTVLLDKAYVLGDAMALIEVAMDVGTRVLNRIYVPPEKMVKMHESTCKISQQWLSRLKTMKSNKYFSLKVLRDLTENKNLNYLKEVLDNVDIPITEEQKELKKFLCFFYHLNDSNYREFINVVYRHRDWRVSKYRMDIPKEYQTQVKETKNENVG